jgi:hypothetical protein
MLWAPVWMLSTLASASAGRRRALTCLPSQDVHRDLEPANIVLTPAGPGVLARFSRRVSRPGFPEGSGMPRGLRQTQRDSVVVNGPHVVLIPDGEWRGPRQQRRERQRRECA